ncbi:hypothetical protein AURDEDRAFT_52077 [Auricularia subglabra TFB-10046 SS5]|nr:hypothetical protein AURDEDRAFT_52077 [Auricularia subglabra TFB-10046 SS5]
MLRLTRAGLLSARRYSTAPTKVPVKLIAELRKATNVPMNKASEALAACNNDLAAAVAWLEEDTKRTGAARAAKLADRVANEGVVTRCILSDGTRGGGLRAALVELACETDFVARGEMFNKLAADIAHTAAFFAEPLGSEPAFKPFPVETLVDAPCLAQSESAPSASSRTITDAIREVVAKVGENVALRRAVTITGDPSSQLYTIGSYVHGAVPDFPSAGRISCLTALRLSGHSPQLLQDAAFQKSFPVLQRALARQIVGLNVETLRGATPISEPDPSSSALFDQPFAMLPGASESETVEQALRTWGSQWSVTVDVTDFIKWKVGETQTAPSST